MAWLKNLFSAAYNLEPDQKRQAKRIALTLVSSLVAVVLFMAGRHASVDADAATSLWTTVIQARGILVRSCAALGVWPLSVVSGLLAYEVFELTDLGKRMVVWAESDTSEIRAAKTRNCGLILAALFFAASQVFSAVLR